MGIFQKFKKSLFSEEEQKKLEEVKKKDDTSSQEAEKKTAKASDAKKADEKSSETGIANLKAKAKGTYDLSHHVLLCARISEKAADLGSQNKYVFLVNPKSNKSEVKKAVHHVFGVTPLNVRMINVKGKSVGVRRGRGKRADYKKAIVTLSKKDSISIYEGV